jgi:hypothetical protein
MVRRRVWSRGRGRRDGRCLSDHRMEGNERKEREGEWGVGSREESEAFEVYDFQDEGASRKKARLCHARSCPNRSDSEYLSELPKIEKRSRKRQGSRIYLFPSSEFNRYRATIIDYTDHAVRCVFGLFKANWAGNRDRVNHGR